MPAFSDLRSQVRRISSWKPLPGVLLSAAIGTYLLAVFVSFARLEEDAFIYFRVAENLAAGHGYVFNIGGEPVETGSSPLWQLALAALAWLPLNVPEASRFLGVAIGAGALALLYRISRATIADRILWPVPSAMLALSLPFVHWTQSGMETALYTLLALWFAYWSLESRTRHRWVLPAILVVLARPEAVLLFASMGVLFLVSGNAAGRRHVLAGAGVVGSALLLATIFRYLVFEDLVVHPFYIKAGGRMNASLAHHLFAEGRLYALLIPVAAVAWTPAYWSRARVLLWSVGGVLGAWGFVTPDGLKPHYRHFVPALPFLYWASIDALAFAAGAIRRSGAIPIARLVAVGFALSIALDRMVPIHFTSSVPNAIHIGLGAWSSHPRRLLGFASRKIAAIAEPLPADRLRGDLPGQDYQALVGAFIGRNYEPGITVVYDQMGQTPYFAGPDINFLDTFGLTDRTVGGHLFQARRGNEPLYRFHRSLLGAIDRLWAVDRERYPTLEAVREHLLGGRPELVLHNHLAGDELEQILFTDPRFAASYRGRYVVGTPACRELVTMYERSDLAVRDPRDLWIPRDLVIREVLGVPDVPQRPRC